MDKKYHTMEYNNAIACEVCGGLNYADDYGNSAKCPHCGWQQCGSNETEEKVYGENNGVQLYSRGEEADYDTLDDFINNGSVEGKRLKDIWDDVVHPCFMYPVASDEDYEELPEDYGTV